MLRIELKIARNISIATRITGRRLNKAGFDRRIPVTAPLLTRENGVTRMHFVRDCRAVGL